MQPMPADAAGQSIGMQIQHVDEKITRITGVDNVINPEYSGGVPGLGILIHFGQHCFKFLGIVRFPQVIDLSLIHI